MQACHGRMDVAAIQELAGRSAAAKAAATLLAYQGHMKKFAVRTHRLCFMVDQLLTCFCFLQHFLTTDEFGKLRVDDVTGSPLPIDGDLTKEHGDDVASQFLSWVGGNYQGFETARQKTETLVCEGLLMGM
jgi:hypothetical protein